MIVIYFSLLKPKEKILSGSYIFFFSLKTRGKVNKDPS